MDLVFDKGSLDSPRGHALLYFRNPNEPDAVWVTYVVILPITVDVSKYVPPFLMSQVGELGATDLSAFAFPPAPERLDSYSVMEELAKRREDDILFAGNLDPADVASAMMSINEAVQSYAARCGEVVGASSEASTSEPDQEPGISVNEVLYGLMSDADRLSELTKLVGRLRFALDGAEPELAKEAETEISVLSEHLPANHGIPQLLGAVKSKDANAATLADLYLQRCFHLVREEYTQVGESDARIRELEGEEAT